MVQHEKYMHRCLELAALGLGTVSPNPMVGAVVVLDDKIIGEGYHQKYGEAHDEVNAINQVVSRFPNSDELLKQATIYVSLEPCAHYGKTPPCADLIIKHQILNVVIGCRDPFAQVDGKGIEKLNAAGINVIVGVLETECQRLNRLFFTRVKKHRPYVILKWAQTADGFFAPEDSTQYWITGTEARKLVHQWRTEEDETAHRYVIVAALFHPRACTLADTGWRGATWSSVISAKRVANRAAASDMVSTITALTFFSTRQPASSLRFPIAKRLGRPSAS